MEPQKLCVIKADGTVEIIARANKKEEYEQFVKLVDGYIETVQVSIPLSNGKLVKRNGYVNEEGLIKRLPTNRAACAMYIHSTIVGTLVVMLNRADTVDIPRIRQLFR
jgi:hypothetical protein